MDHKKSDEERFKRTRALIQQFGLQVILIPASEYLPSFAYSIGLWQTYHHPEIICFGLPIETLHAVINDAAEMIKNGESIQEGQTYPDIFEHANARFVKIDERNLADYFGYGLNYENNTFPALQLVWPDSQGLFPWEAGFDEDIKYRQPLLDRNAQFKFGEPENLTVFASGQWIKDRLPILRAIHDTDGDWIFLTEQETNESDLKIVALKDLVNDDPSLNELFNLEYGEEATRVSPGDAWKRRPATHHLCHLLAQ